MHRVNAGQGVSTFARALGPAQLHVLEIMNCKLVSTSLRPFGFCQLQWALTSKACAHREMISQQAWQRGLPA